MSGLRWVLIGIAITKGFDTHFLYTGFSLCWLSMAVALLVLPQRVGYGLLATFCWGGALLQLTRMSTHVVLIGWVALILALWPDEATRLRLLRVQVIVLYALAGISKINPRFLSGDVVRFYRDSLPFPQVLALSAVCVELGMAFLIWRRSRWALPLAVALHLSILVMWTSDFIGNGPGLLVFNVLAVALVATVTPARSAAARCSVPIHRAALSHPLSA
jgi:hypothetical protein